MYKTSQKTVISLRSAITVFGSCFALAVLLFWINPAIATEKYAEETGKRCADCHLDPAGGGELTEEGKSFENRLSADTGNETMERSGVSILRLITGYLHLLTAVFWFGTILYVHLILKPAYAAAGLPKGEKRVGLISMIVMLITGTILTIFRISSWEMLCNTRFGILLLFKITFFVMMVGTALIAVFFIGPKLRRRKANFESGSGSDKTPEELRYFDGKEGRPAYIAYTGNIYDVTKSGIWYDGIHFFRHPAGIDLTRFLAQAPHGEEKILKMPKIGKIVSSEEKKAQSKYERLFYFIAYFNLTMVLFILLILALWKWWI